MTIGKLCKCEVITVSKDMTVYEAAELMKKHNIGDIVVVDEKNHNHPIGIFTDRDVTIKIVADAIEPNSITVKDAMSQELLTLKEHQSIHEVMDLMCARRVRRAPIIDRDNQIIGIATVDDLILLIADELSSLAKLIRRQISN